MAPLVDPLDGLEYRPLEVQVAVLATEARNQRNALYELGGELRALKRALYGLAISIVLAAVSTAFTALVLIGHH